MSMSVGLRRMRKSRTQPPAKNASWPWRRSFSTIRWAARRIWIPGTPRSRCAGAGRGAVVTRRAGPASSQLLQVAVPGVVREQLLAKGSEPGEALLVAQLEVAESHPEVEEVAVLELLRQLQGLLAFQDRFPIASQLVVVVGQEGPDLGPLQVAARPAPQRLESHQQRLFELLQPEVALGDLRVEPRQALALRGALLELQGLLVSF